MSFSVLDFLPTYPSNESDNFIYELTRRKEFYDLKLERTEPIPEEPGVLLQSQEIISRFMNPHTPYKKILLFRGMGTGKCLHPDSFVLTNIGYRPISTMWENEPDMRSDEEWLDVRDRNIFTLSLNEEGKYVQSRITRLYRQRIDENMNDIVLKDGRRIRCTLAHRFHDGFGWTNDYRAGKLLFGLSRVDLPGGWERNCNLNYKHIQVSDFWTKVMNDKEVWKELVYFSKEDCNQLIIFLLLNFLKLDGENFRMDWYPSFRMSEIIAFVASRLNLNYTIESKVVEGETWYRVSINFVEEKSKHTKIISSTLFRYQGIVYDFEVEKYSNYLSSGLWCHNTCILSAIVENFKNVSVGGKPRNPALVFVLSEDLVRNFNEEIAYRCTKGGIYVPELSQKEMSRGMVMTEEMRTRKLSRLISQTYEIVHLRSFLMNLPDNKEAIRRKYSNREILIDEAHVIRKSSGKDEKESKKLYGMMHDFIHTVEGCNIGLSTGTPIWDKTSEIAALMNLILPKDQQLPTGNKFYKAFFKGNDLTSEGEEILKERFRGKISYLRPMVDKIDKEVMGTSKPWFKHLKVYPNGMSDFQAKYVREAQKRDTEIRKFHVKGKIVEREVKGNSLMKKAREASNFVLPVFDEEGNVTGGAFGKKLFQDYCVSKKTMRTKKGEMTNINEYSIKNNFLKREIKNNLQVYSAKFASIIKWILDHPDELIFIYSEFVTGPGGAIFFGLCLREFGFAWAKSASEISKASSTKRFAIITSDPFTTSQPKKIRELINSINLPDNKTARRCQVLIGSEKIALGISLKNFRKVDILSAYWNLSGIDQPLYRIFRLGSFLAFDEPVQVNVCLHVTVEIDEEKNESYDTGFPRKTSFSSHVTPDIYIYRIAEEKDLKNAQIVRLMKEVAVDCALNYERNVLEEDKKGSRECNYQKCNYECENFENIDKSGKVWKYTIDKNKLIDVNYRLYYAEHQMKKLIFDIRSIFLSSFSISFDELLEYLEEPNEYLVLSTLDYIITSQVPLRNKYGVLCYLREENNIYYLCPDISSFSNFLQNFYTSSILFVEKLELKDCVEYLEIQEDEKILVTMCKNIKPHLFDRLSFSSQIDFFEKIYALENSGQQIRESYKPIRDKILSTFDKSIIETSDGNKIHILYTEEFKGMAYDVVAKDIKELGKTRIFNETKGEWEFIENPEEEEKYLEEIKKIHKQEKDIGFDDNPYEVYGWESKIDGKFRINRKEEGKKTEGIVCKTIVPVDKIYDIILNNMKHLPEARDSMIAKDKKTLKELIKRKKLSYDSVLDKVNEIITRNDHGELSRLATLFEMKKGMLCSEMKNWLTEHNLMKDI